ncbi:MAG: amidohydrolase family protein, partial [Planctomycetales bacterium]|nr:amidohydrolase family protein [Planctomycetales bacterium]
RLYSLTERKGRLEPGLDADIAVWDPEASFVVEEGSILHRHKLSPYTGQKLDGVVKRTYVRGRLVYQDGQILGPPRGKLLTA